MARFFNKRFNWKRFNHWWMRQRLRLRLYQQLLILLAVTLVLPLALIGAWVYDIHDSALRKQVQALQQEALDWLPRFVEQQATQQTQLEGQLQDTLDSFTPSTITDGLAVLLKSQPTLVAVGQCQALQARLGAWQSKETLPPAWLTTACLPSTTHRVIQAELPHTQADWFWQQQPLSPRQHGASAYQHINEWRLAVRWLDKTGHVTSWAWFRQTPLHQSLHLLQQQNGGTGLTWFHLNSQQHTPIKLPPAEQQQLWKRMNNLAQESASANVSTFALGTGDNDFQGVLVVLPQQQLALVVNPAQHGHKQLIAEARQHMILLLVLALVASTAIGMAYIWGMMRNFRQLIKGTDAMAEGNYRRRIRLLLNWVTPYEVVYLTNQFNRAGQVVSSQVEALQEANQTLATLDAFKSDLIDTVSHELRTPLANIQGYTSQLLRHEETVNPDQRRQHLKTILQQARRLSRLVDDLLVIPELDEQRIRVACEPVFLADTLNQARQGLLPHQRHRLKLTPFSEDIALLADADRLEQVLLNLIENACKYGYHALANDEEEAPPVYVRVEAEEESPAPRIHLHISNPCQPFDTEKLPELFEKFKRLEEGLQRTSRGSGLGLYISHALVKAMLGELHLSLHPDDTHPEVAWFTASVTLPRANV
ncbi:MAG: sensor histidine kinase [Vampirovibrionales bacterium]